MATSMFSNNLSDHVYMAASKVLNGKSDGQYNVIRIPRFAFVENVYLWVSTVFAGGAPTMTVGFEGNSEVAVANYFMTDTEAAPTVAGFKKATDLAGFNGKYFGDGVGIITCTIAGTPTSGICRFFMSYSIIH